MTILGLIGAGDVLGPGNLGQQQERPRDGPVSARSDEDGLREAVEVACRSAVATEHADGEVR